MLSIPLFDEVTCRIKIWAQRERILRQIIYEDLLQRYKYPDFLFKIKKN